MLGFGFNAMVVEEASAIQGMDRTVPIDKDHLQICKPNSRCDVAYVKLYFFLKKYLPVS